MPADIRAEIPDFFIPFIAKHPSSERFLSIDFAGCPTSATDLRPTAPRSPANPGVWRACPVVVRTRFRLVPRELPQLLGTHAATKAHRPPWPRPCWQGAL